MPFAPPFRAMSSSSACFARTKRFAAVGAVTLAAKAVHPRASVCGGQLIGDGLAGTVTKGRLGIDMLAAAISAQFIR